jgi:FMN phosphatase YigB (HAD superfamily)
MPALADVQALVFDVFGTVVDWRGGVARESAAFLARYAPSADPAAFADAWRRRYSPAMEEVRSGRRSFVRLDVLHRENLSRDSQVDQRKRGPLEIEGVNGLMDCCIEGIGVGEGLMGEMMRLEVAPDAFDVV